APPPPANRRIIMLPRSKSKMDRRIRGIKGNLHVDENTQAVRAARTYSRDHSERFRRELHEFLRIPSLSGDPARHGGVKRAAEWLAAHMKALGLKSSRVMPTGGHPVVYAEWMGAGRDK